MKEAAVSQSPFAITDEFLLVAASLPYQKLEQVSTTVKKIMAEQRRQNGLSEEEILVKKINSIFPASMMREQKKLFKKLKNDTISEDEREKLRRINALVLEKNADWILLLKRLAEIRGTSYHEVIEHSDIKRFQHEKTPPVYF